MSDATIHPVLLSLHNQNIAHKHKTQQSKLILNIITKYQDTPDTQLIEQFTHQLTSNHTSMRHQQN